MCAACAVAWFTSSIKYQSVKVRASLERGKLGARRDAVGTCRSVYDRETAGGVDACLHAGTMNFVTLSRLNRAVADVQRELERHGFYDYKLAKIDIYLSWVGYAYGWCWYGTSGNIHIPAVSLGKMFERVVGAPRSTLRDTLRHEYGHALAHTHRALFCSVPFKRAFGSHHDADIRSNYDPERHVTSYAATSPSEDFAESFMTYLRHNGELPDHFDTCRIRRKWRFVRDLGVAVGRGQRRWKSLARANG